MAPKLLSLAEAAELLGVAASTMRQQARSGALRAQKVGTTYVVTPAEVERYRRENLGKVGRPRKPKA